MKTLAQIVDTERHPILAPDYQTACRKTLDDQGVLLLDGFLPDHVIDTLCEEGRANQHLAYYTANAHNAYLCAPEPSYPPQHPRNRELRSSKGCITTDQIPDNSVLNALYASPDFKTFLCSVLNEPALYQYADPLSSINLHYAADGEELAWHYDNSSFAITLLIQKPRQGARFEYVRNVRNADAGDMAFEETGRVLDGQTAPSQVPMEDGSLVLFRGRNSIHRVTPTEGDLVRMLVVLAYNTEPDISLSESARMTFYGRLN